MEPTVNKLILEGKPIVVVKVTTQAEVEAHGAKHVPTTFAYKKGKLLSQTEGELDEKALRKLVKDTGGR
jgi:thioredoxin-like negative regulator of GroEL